MKSIYKNPDGRNQVLRLYDAQLNRCPANWKDVYVQTSFGKTHLIETGAPQGIPLLVFHGGNATTAYTLLACDFLFDDFHIYAVDTIGHPGKSAETCLSSSNDDYGKWAGEVIDALGYAKINCFGGSFGAGIIAKAMCVAPNQIKNAVLYVPSGICNAPAYHSMNMMLPMLAYWMTHKKKWLEKALLPMAVALENIDADTFETAKNSIDHTRIKAGMPSNVDCKRMKKCSAHVLVLAAELDCLFPANLVLPRAEKIIPDCTTYLLKDRGHMNVLSEEEKRMIVDFLKK